MGTIVISNKLANEINRLGKILLDELRQNVFSKLSDLFSEDDINDLLEGELCVDDNGLRFYANSDYIKLQSRGEHSKTTQNKFEEVVDSEAEKLPIPKIDIRVVSFEGIDSLRILCLPGETFTQTEAQQ